MIMKKAIRSAEGDAVARGTGVDGLVAVVQQLSLARDVATVQEIVRRAARALTGADGATFVLRDDDKCFYADEDAIEPLWKGQRFPLEMCISGWAMLNRQPTVIPDIYADDRIPHAAYRPTFVKSLCMVPIRSADPIGAIGNYWAEHYEPTAEEVGLLQALADTTAVALVHVQNVERLEQIVNERTEEIRQLSLTDELTGVYNRRGFLDAAAIGRGHLRRTGGTGHLVFADIDGLKTVNDSHGHDAGDALIRNAARALRSAVRETDVVGRWGGDELVLFAIESSDGTALVERLRDATARRGVSVSLGSATFDASDARSLDELVQEADFVMYRNRREQRTAGSALPVQVTER